MCLGQSLRAIQAHTQICPCHSTLRPQRCHITSRHAGIATNLCLEGLLLPYPNREGMLSWSSHWRSTTGSGQSPRGYPQPSALCMGPTEITGPRCTVTTTGKIRNVNSPSLVKKNHRFKRRKRNQRCNCQTYSSHTRSVTCAQDPSSCVAILQTFLPRSAAAVRQSALIGPEQSA